ncbi:MAG TPA: OmpA family protein [Polyangiaceae bacterium]|nr:OmpA family protein [Polyangiaceae bacterium]
MSIAKNPCHRPAWLGCGALALLLAACSHHEPALSASQIMPQAANEPGESQRVGEESQQLHASRQSPPSQEARDNGTSIHLSQEIVQQCRFPVDVGELPLFDVNESTLKPRGRDILADVANCMKDGPLESRTITIIGRTDSRGTEEHNQQLGASRADATRNYLLERGVPARKLLVISRGEQGATGNDEASMALDRRVDLMLGDATERTSLEEHPAANQKLDRSNRASTYADQVEGGRASGELQGSSGPGTDSVPGK